MCRFLESPFSPAGGAVFKVVMQWSLFCTVLLSQNTFHRKSCKIRVKDMSESYSAANQQYEMSWWYCCLNFVFVFYPRKDCLVATTFSSPVTWMNKFTLVILVSWFRHLLQRDSINGLKQSPSFSIKTFYITCIFNRNIKALRIKLQAAELIWSLCHLQNEYISIFIPFRVCDYAARWKWLKRMAVSRSSVWFPCGWRQER